MKLYDIHIQCIMYAQSIFWAERRMIKLPPCPGFCPHQWVATYWWGQPKTCPQLGIKAPWSYKHAPKNPMSIASLVVLEWACTPPPPPQNRKSALLWLKECEYCQGKCMALWATIYWIYVPSFKYPPQVLGILPLRYYSKMRKSEKFSLIPCIQPGTLHRRARYTLYNVKCTLYHLS